jgi:hypothetical protein
MRQVSTATHVHIARQGGDDEDKPVTTHSEKPLKVVDCRRNCGLVGNNNFTNNMVTSISQLCDRRENAVTVSTEEGGVVEAIYDDRQLWW